MMQIKGYQSADYSAIEQILKQANLFWKVSDAQEIIEREISRDRLYVLVATIEKNVIGLILIQPGFMPLLFRLAVTPAYRRRGIGTALMKKAEEWLQKEGYNHANILVSSNEINLIEYYTKRGYAAGNTYQWMTRELK